VEESIAQFCLRSVPTELNNINWYWYRRTTVDGAADVDRLEIINAESTRLPRAFCLWHDKSIIYIYIPKTHLQAHTKHLWGWAKKKNLPFPLFPSPPVIDAIPQTQNRVTYMICYIHVPRLLLLLLILLLSIYMSYLLYNYNYYYYYYYYYYYCYCCFCLLHSRLAVKLKCCAFMPANEYIYTDDDEDDYDDDTTSGTLTMYTHNIRSRATKVTAALSKTSRNYDFHFFFHTLVLVSAFVCCLIL